MHDLEAQPNIYKTSLRLGNRKEVMNRRWKALGSVGKRGVVVSVYREQAAVGGVDIL